MANDLSMLLVVVIWGANFSIVKLSLAQIPPLAFTALRFTAATALLLLILRFREGRVSLPPHTLWKLIWLGVVGNTLYQVLFIPGLSLTTAANSALFVAATPVMVALLGALLKIERLTRHVTIGIALAFFGITLVVAARGLSVSRATLAGDALVLAGTVCWAIYTLGVRSLAPDISSLRITALTLLTGTPGLILLGLPSMLKTEWSGLDRRAWGGLAYATLFGLVVAYLLWNASVRKVGGSRTAVYTCVTPLVATLVAWPLLGERPVPLQAFGAALIVGGVLLTRRRATNKSDVTTPLIEEERSLHATG